MNKRTLSSELLAGARYLKRRTVQKNVVKIQMITRALIEKISDVMGIHLRCLMRGWRPAASRWECT